jgi:hypothetical protein
MVKALEKHVQTLYNQGTTLYASYCSIIQSSGMGKSRLLDEFSRTHFLIPVNLCPEYLEGHEGQKKYHVSGFPPADIAVRNFFISSGQGTAKDNDEKAKDKLKDKSFPQVCYFLKVLFTVTLEMISKFNATNEADRTTKFWEFMSEGQSMQSSGPKRSAFYHKMVDMATKVRCESVFFNSV